MGVHKRSSIHVLIYIKGMDTTHKCGSLVKMVSHLQAMVSALNSGCHWRCFGIRNLHGDYGISFHLVIKARICYQFILFMITIETPCLIKLLDGKRVVTKRNTKTIRGLNCINLQTDAV